MTMLLEKEETITDAIHIIIADDHPLVRGALKQALTSGIKGAEIR